MSTQQLNGSNGTANGKPVVPKVATVVTIPAKKEEEVKPKIIVKDDLPPVEDRILKVQQLMSKVEKHEALNESLRKLHAFKLSSDGSKDVLKISDSKGREFSTSNSTGIADVIETLKKSIAEKIVALEKELVF